jgi:hypothetical protein
MNIVVFSGVKEEKKVSSAYETNERVVCVEKSYEVDIFETLSS